MAKKRRHEEHENHERWLVSYADFITLLFAFFVVLYATSQADQEKQEEFEESIKQQFAGYMISGSGSGGGESHGSGRDLLSDEFPSRRSGPREVHDYVERKLENVDEETLTGIQHDTLGVRIQMAASKLFPSGTADLKASSLQALDQIGPLLKASGRKIVIEGHTDDEPIRTEKYPSNWELSAARATRIVRHLISRYGVDPNRITAVAYADQKPVVPNGSEENRARNRRIEILIVTGSGTP